MKINLSMISIEKVELPCAELQNFIEYESRKYEFQNGILCNFVPFSFCAKENNEIVGAITGYTCYQEIYIDELIVKESKRFKSIGTQLLNTVEKYYENSGFVNINLCTNEFQSPKFYEKLGFELEFVRKNPFNSKLNKYFYVKYYNRNI